MSDRSVLVRAWRSKADAPNPALRAMLLAGVAFDSFTGAAIPSEVAEVLARPTVGSGPGQVSGWLDASVRASRQVFPKSISGDDRASLVATTMNFRL